jgi:hypothetical protein
MRVEAIVTKAELATLIPALAPAQVRFADGGELLITDPTEIALVPNAGLRFVCAAKLKWPVLGITLPLTVRSAQILVRPHIETGGAPGLLAFTVVIEHADFAILPDAVDAHIVAKVNLALESKRDAMTWSFGRTLGHVFVLPAALEQLRGIGLRVDGGEVRVTAEALTLGVWLHGEAVRAPARAETETTPSAQPDAS